MNQTLYLADVLRPWKLLTFAVGMSWLIWGAIHYQFSDWDIGICFVMGFSTYLSAPWCIRTILKSYRERKLSWPIVGAIFAWYWSVDGCYWVYHTLIGNTMIRYENLLASTGLYFSCAIIWGFNGSLAELWRAIVNARMT